MHIGTPFTRNAGYHYDGAGRERDENDVQTCPHCQAVILMQQWKKIEAGKLTGGFCMKCNRPTCEKPACQSCVPFIQKLERELDMTVKLAQFMRDAGLEPVPKRPLFTGLVKE